MTDIINATLGDLKSSPNAYQSCILSNVTLWSACHPNNTDNWDI